MWPGSPCRCRCAQQEHSNLVDEVTVGAEIEVEIAAHAAACENADGASGGLRQPAGIFHGFPRAFQELTVLRIHDRSLLRAHPEELGIEHLHGR